MAARTHAEHSSSAGHTGRRRMNSQQDGEPSRPGLVTGATALEKAAQGGQGFITSGLDLGVLGTRNNVDDDFRRHGAASGGLSGGSAQSSSHDSHHSTSSGGGSSYRASSSGYQSGASSGSHGQSYSSHGGHHSSDDQDYEQEQEIDYDENAQDSEQQGAGQGSTWSRTSNYAYSHGRPLNSRHENINQQFKHYPQKREIRLGSEPLCKSTRCVNVRCVVGPLEKNTDALIALRTRLVVHTLDKVKIAMWKIEIQGFMNFLFDRSEAVRMK